MTITDHDVERVVGDAWAALLGLTVHAIGHGDQDPTGAHPIDVNATVHVEGAWLGYASLSCSARLGVLFAASMLGVRADDVDERATADALGELTNVVTGNLKSLLPVTCRLALPSVERREPSAPASGDVTGAGLRVVRFSCLGDVLLVAFALNPALTPVGSAS